MPLKYAKRKAMGRKYRYRKYAKTGLSRALRNSHTVKYFTEMVDLGTMNFVSGAAGGKLSVRLSNLPNFTAYSGLFEQFSIIRSDFVLLPVLGQYVIGSSPPPVRFVYAINRDPLSLIPTTEADVLSEDNSRITVLSGKSKLKIRVKNPCPFNTQISGTTGTAIGVHQPTKRWQWLSMTSPGTLTDWMGVNYFYTNPDQQTQASMQLYARVTVAFKEQQ